MEGREPVCNPPGALVSGKGARQGRQASARTLRGQGRQGHGPCGGKPVNVTDLEMATHARARACWEWKGQGREERGPVGDPRGVLASGLSSPCLSAHHVHDALGDLGLVLLFLIDVEPPVHLREHHERQHQNQRNLDTHTTRFICDTATSHATRTPKLGTRNVKISCVSTARVNTHNPARTAPLVSRIPRY